MEVVDKKGQVIQEEPKTIPYEEFLKLIKQYKEVRCALAAGKPPFDFVYLKVVRGELTGMKVTYSIAYNSRVQSHLLDILYIHKMELTII